MVTAATRPKERPNRRKMDRSYDLICLSHLRWDFVFQRPQHLMTRFATRRRVFFIEEPQPTEGNAHMLVKRDSSGVQVVVPQSPAGADAISTLRKLLENFLIEHRVGPYCLWYYTPMPVAWTAHLKPTVTIYDCMDELSGFKNAPADLKQREVELLEKADLVFTGGHSLFEAKRRQHVSVYPFPSSIDVTHFAKARGSSPDPEDQSPIPRPRLGYCGVIDERMDLELIAAVADARPEWHFVMVGPVAKIDVAALPKRSNIHFLGMKSYRDLPAYLSGWDVAILPFARNESTRFISPTKTPEYLAAGRPVVSTSIRDVINPYGIAGVVHIADEPADFIKAIERALAEDSKLRCEKVDGLLSKNSWCRTWGRMAELIDDVVHRRTRTLTAPFTGLTQGQLQPFGNGPAYLRPE